MSKIAMTGASGGFGSNATAKLIEMGRAEDLILITRSPEKLAHMAEKGCVVRYGDYDKPETMSAAMEGADRLLLISGTRVGHRLPQHKAAIDGAVRAGVRHVAYTGFIVHDLASPAIVTPDHVGTELMLRESGLAWTFLRDGHYADSMIMMAAPQFIATGYWPTSTENSREAMVWRDDCIDSAVAVLTQDGHEDNAYRLSGPNLENFSEIAAMLTEVTGKAIEVREVGDEGMFAHFDALGIPRHPVDDQTVAKIPFCSNDMVSFERTIREGWMNIKTDDVEFLTGHKPRSVRDMIELNADYLRSFA